MSSYSPGRPPTERDIVTSINGNPVFLGAIVSAAGAVTSNATTATPFNTPPSTGGFAGSLAGRVLLVQTTAAGSVLPAFSSVFTLVLQTAVLAPPASVPGVLLGSAATAVITMDPKAGWLQWLPSAGAGTLFVWELL